MPHQAVRDDVLLVDLMSAVRRARRDVDRGRALRPTPVSAQEQGRRMQDLAHALQEFADAASTAGVPLPYRYRDEIRLYEALYPRLGRPAGPASHDNT